MADLKQNEQANKQMPQAQARTGSVIVGCKLPNGIRLTIKTPQGEEHRVLKGNAHYYQHAQDRKFTQPDLVVGDSLTTISAEFWDAWVATHKDYEPYKKGMIYAAKSREDAKAIATETAGMKTGLEQLDPKAHGVRDVNDNTLPQ